MNVVRAALFLGVVVLGAVVSIAAQGAPQPSPAAMTTAKTWTDADLDKLMKEVNSTFGMLRKSIEAQNLEPAKEQSDKLEMLFEDVDDFWNSRNVRDAADFADDAAEHADHIEDAVDAKDFAKAAEHLKLLQSVCSTCHGKYRDKAPDGGFRIKP